MTLIFAFVSVFIWSGLTVRLNARICAVDRHRDFDRRALAWRTGNRQAPTHFAGAAAKVLEPEVPSSSIQYRFRNKPWPVSRTDSCTEFCV